MQSSEDVFTTPIFATSARALYQTARLAVYGGCRGIRRGENARRDLIERIHPRKCAGHRH